LAVPDLVRAAGPAVVLIEGAKPRGGVQGTGFILSPDGIIVTNHHVVAGATHVQVKLTNGWLFSALGVVGFSEEKDLALIKVSAPALPSLRLGNSDRLEAGERVVVIGNPLGLENTVADGLVSSIRQIQNGIKVIQITAPISEGNSGSPIFNMRGEVVGVASFKIAKAENLNFAVAGNHIRELTRMGKPIPFAHLLPPLPAVDPHPTRPAVPTLPAPSADRPPEALLPPEDVYRNALSDYTNGKYDLAISGFRIYIQKYPKTSLVPNAQYWLGESYYGQKNYAQAVEEFKVVIRDYPYSPKVPSALFKQGDAYLMMGETRRGIAALCELLTRHAGTREARLARERNVRCQ
jgi:tol-pal system protein YbgF